MLENSSWARLAAVKLSDTRSRALGFLKGLRVESHTRPAQTRSEKVTASQVPVLGRCSFRDPNPDLPTQNPVLIVRSRLVLKSAMSCCFIRHVSLCTLSSITPREGRLRRGNREKCTGIGQSHSERSSRNSRTRAAGPLTETGRVG